MLLSRYSYSIEYYGSIKYSTFSRLRDAASKNIELESRDKFLPPAYLFWLENVSGSNNSMNFDKMCKELGLIKESKPDSNLSKKIKASEAIKRAEQIRALDKKRIQEEIKK